MRTIRTRQAEILGDVIRKSHLENLVMTGKFDGNKVPGRPRTSYLTSLRKWLDHAANENIIIQASATRQRWRDIIVYARTGHGT